ncbi:MAG: YhbY family RNA-binding protein [Desulfobacteraceae bacterium]|nr:YhbY family RNA-binding protein [Desulfobacteraceae bacterium]
MNNKNELKGSQRKYLRGLAHDLKPSAYVGQKGLTQGFLDEVDVALGASELIKVKFVDFKEKEVKKELAQEIASSADCEIAGIIGHIVIFYRQNKDTKKRKIKLPK